MPKKPTPADANLILTLYDLRREAELRKARNWWLVDFWPDSADDFMKVVQAMGTPENNWLRQVPSYWELAASLVLHGTVNETLFLEPACSGEMFLVFAKVHPFLQDVREKMQNPRMLANVEKVIKKSKAGQERLKVVEQRLAARRKQMKRGRRSDVAACRHWLSTTFSCPLWLSASFPRTAGPGRWPAMRRVSRHSRQ